MAVLIHFVRRLLPDDDYRFVKMNLLAWLIPHCRNLIEERFIAEEVA